MEEEMKRKKDGRRGRKMEGEMDTKEAGRRTREKGR